MYINDKILMAKNGNKEFYIIPKMANRHGLIAGGSGSGKTVTLKVMAESFSNIGVPVLLADVKGDLAGMCIEGENTEDMQKRIEKFKLNDYGFNYQKFPTQFFEIERSKGLPVRTTISNFGPTLLAHIMELNQTQADILNVIFKIADDENLLLLDLKDLKKMLEFVNENSKELSTLYGNITKTSVQAIQRAIISLEQEGIEKMFGEPELDLYDIIKTDANGKGFINILHSSNLILSPRIYSAFMLWLLSNIYESMPEVGDLDKPKLVFFFDEAHLLFNDSTPALLKKIDQMAKLIRSKGIGLYFITQDPTDIPDTILQQLGNKIQHVHRSYTARDKKNHKAICDSFRDNKDLDISEVLETLGTGEALISFLDEKGAPNVVDKANVLPPQSKMGTIDDSERDKQIKASTIYAKYINDIDRESAYEVLCRETEKAIAEREEQIKQEELLKEQLERQKIEEKLLKEQEKLEKEQRKQEEKMQKEWEKQIMKEYKEKKSKQTAMEKKLNTTIKSVARSTGTTIGRELAQSLATSIFGRNSKQTKKVAGNVGAALGRNILGTFLRG